LFLFTFSLLLACFKMHATQPQPKVQQQPKDCVKHPQIVKPQSSEKPKVVAEKVVKAVTTPRGNTSIPHFSVLNFINFFYTKDTLDNLHVM
jgi:hypothetical protein